MFHKKYLFLVVDLYGYTVKAYTLYTVQFFKTDMDD